VRSDVERKVLAHVSETERLAPSHYSQAASRAVYGVIVARAEAALRAGQSAVLDAVFARPCERAAAEEAARRVGAQFAGFWLEADPAVLKARVLARRGDASDADAAVVETQLGYDLGTICWERIDAGGSAADAAASITRRLPPPPGGPA
jgi:hypothetical protein